jgi:hypothetical protein
MALRMNVPNKKTGSGLAFVMPGDQPDESNPMTALGYTRDADAS